MSCESETTRIFWEILDALEENSLQKQWLKLFE